MASQDAPKHYPFLYPQVDQSNPDSHSNPLTEPDPIEETVITVPGAIVHLIDDQRSVELASGEFSVVRIRQGDRVIAVLARVGYDVQWPLLKDEAAVKLDGSHYFFSFRSPEDSSGLSNDDHNDKGKTKEKPNKNKGKTEEAYCDVLNYGLTFASKGQMKRLEELDKLLQTHSRFSVQSVKGGTLDKMVAVMEWSPEIECAAYWTILAPNVEDYSGAAAKMIAAGSGQLIRGILWCGDVTVDRLQWGNEVLKKRMTSDDHKVEISPKTLRRIKRAKRLTKTTQKVANAVLEGIVKVSGHFTSSVANTTAGRKFFSQIPGEILLASLDGFNQICDAIEVAGKNVMATSSTVTTSLVTHKYGEEAGEATREGLHAAGHVIWTVWTVYKIRKIINPKAAFTKATLSKFAAEAAATEYKSKRDSKPN